MIRKAIVAAAALLATLPLAPSTAIAANLTVKDGAGATQTLCARTQTDGSLAECHVILDTTNTQIDPATKQLQQSAITALGSPFQAGGSIGNASFGAKLLDSTGAAFGTSVNPVYVTGISGGGTASSVTINGTLPAFAATPTFNIGTAPTIAVTAASLPLPAGAATAAGVATINTTLGSPFQAGGSIGNTAFGITGALPAGTNAIGTVSVTALPALPTGANNIGSLANITGTVSLPTGAATSALQATGNTSLASIITALAPNITYLGTTTPLAASGTYTGAARDTGAAPGTGLAYSYFNAAFYADQTGSAFIDGSNDGTTWFPVASSAFTASTPLTLTTPVMFRYHRARFVNGSTAQTTFVVNSSYTAS